MPRLESGEVKPPISAEARKWWPDPMVREPGGRSDVDPSGVLFLFPDMLDMVFTRAEMCAVVRRELGSTRAISVGFVFRTQYDAHSNWLDGSIFFCKSCGRVLQSRWPARGSGDVGRRAGVDGRLAIREGRQINTKYKKRKKRQEVAAAKGREHDSLGKDGVGRGR
jgi:hypothetical protein